MNEKELPITKKVKENFKNIRLAAGLTQEKFAKVLEEKESVIQRIEQGLSSKKDNAFSMIQSLYGISKEEIEEEILDIAELKTRIKARNKKVPFDLEQEASLLNLLAGQTIAFRMIARLREKFEDIPFEDTIRQIDRETDEHLQVLQRISKQK